MNDGRLLSPRRSETTVFIDRDGVINRDSPDYIKSCDEFEFLPGSLKALRLLNENGYSVIVVTNQSVIGRNMIPLSELHLIFDHMKRSVSTHGGHITDIFFCPHHPNDGCNCRKPATGMIMQARDTHSIDLTRAIMIGDSVKDILCARNAGIGSSVLVLTGNGTRARATLESQGIEPTHVAENLLDAVNWILETPDI